MTGHRRWREIRRQLSPEAEARIETCLAEARQQDALDLRRLREARRQTQVALAEAMGTNQPEVSRIERQTDLHLSTLRRYIEGLGGELIIRARFDDREMPIPLTEDLASEERMSG